MGVHAGDRFHRSLRASSDRETSSVNSSTDASSVKTTARNANSHARDDPDQHRTGCLSGAITEGSSHIVQRCITSAGERSADKRVPVSGSWSMIPRQNAQRQWTNCVYGPGVGNSRDFTLDTVEKWARDFGCGLRLPRPGFGMAGGEIDQKRIHADPNALMSKSAAARWRRSDCRRSIFADEMSRRRSPWRRS